MHTVLPISIIIPTWRRPQVLQLTLDSLRSEPRALFEVIVVCDGPDHATRAFASDYLAPFTMRWLWLEHNQGPPMARNRGVEAAAGDWLLFLDDDTSADPGLIQAFHHAFSAVDSQVVIAGRIVEAPDRPPLSRAEAHLRRVRARDILAAEAAFHSVRGEPGRLYYIGPNCCIARETFIRLGGYDPRLRDGDDETELGSRAYAAGILLRPEPRAIVYHHDTKDLRRYYIECARPTALHDLYRVREKSERSSQNAHLARINSPSPARRLHARFIFRHTEAAATLARAALRLGELSGLPFFFRAWSDQRFLSLPAPLPYQYLEGWQEKATPAACREK